MRRATSGRLLQHLSISAAASLLALIYCTPAAAVTVNGLTYDAEKNQLVMTIYYRGTNPDHAFSVQWAECDRLDDERSQILGLLIDSQPNDLARQEFTQEFKVDLASFSCRPAKVTIRTSAGFFMSVDVPEAQHKNTPSSAGREARNATLGNARNSLSGKHRPDRMPKLLLSEGDAVGGARGEISLLVAHLQTT